MRRLLRLWGMIVSVSLATVPVMAQHGVPDSLERELHTTDDYERQLQLLGELSDHYSYTDSAKALVYAHKMEALAEKHQDRRGLGIAQYRIGGVYFEVREQEKAIAAYEMAEKWLQADTSYLGRHTLAKVWHNHGALYQWKGDSDTYLDLILNRAIPIQEEIGDSMGMGRNLYNIGLIFQNAREYDRAIHYHRKSVQTLLPYPGVPEYPDALIKLAESMMSVAPTRKISRDSVSTILDAADAALDNYPDSYSRVYYLQARGMYAEQFDRDMDRALNYYEQAFQLATESRIPRQASSSLTRLYQAYQKMGNYREALRTARLVYRDYVKYLTPQDQVVVLQQLVANEERMGNVQEAYRLQTLQTALNDSIHKAEVAVKIHNLEQRYEAKSKEAQIAKLNQQMEAQEASARWNRLLSASLGVAVVLVLGISLAGYNIFRKQRLIARQQAELLRQDLEKISQEQQIKLFAAVLEGQEQERKRLAIDLHDGLGGALSSIKMKLSRVVQGVQGDVMTQELPAVLGQLDASVDDLRRIARNMMPETLLKYGLAVALRDFCKSSEQEGTTISFQSYGLSLDIPSAVQIMVYRIIQELITNAVKHANASQILAQCLQHENELSITVEDDGVGLPDTAANRPGMGLSNVRTRVAYLGGKLDIQSERGVGTTVNIELTYADEQQVD